MRQWVTYVSLGVLAALALGAGPATADTTPSASFVKKSTSVTLPLRIRFRGNTDYCLGVASAGLPEAGSTLKLVPCLYQKAHVDLAYDSTSGRIRFAAKPNVCVGKRGSPAESGQLVATACSATDAVAVDFKSSTIALRGTESLCVDKSGVARQCEPGDADLKWTVINDPLAQARQTDESSERADG
jgi:hypothetical protein